MKHESMKRKPVQSVPQSEPESPAERRADLQQQHAAAVAQLADLKKAEPRPAEAVAAQKQTIQRLADAISRLE